MSILGQQMSGNLVMGGRSYGFYNKDLATRSSDGLNSMSLEPLYYLDSDGTWYCVPTGSWSDGVSTPRIIWATDPPVGADRWFAGRLHDASPKYRCTLLIWKDGHWTVAIMSREQCDALIKRALISCGMPPAKAEEYFVALHLAGENASEGDLSGTIGKLTLPPPPPVWVNN